MTNTSKLFEAPQMLIDEIKNKGDAPVPEEHLEFCQQALVQPTAAIGVLVANRLLAAMAMPVDDPQRLYAIQFAEAAVRDLKRIVEETFERNPVQALHRLAAAMGAGEEE